MKYTTEQAREAFQQAIDAATDTATKDRMRLCMEYFTNPDFRSAMSDYLWEMTK